MATRIVSFSNTNSLVGCTNCLYNIRLFWALSEARTTPESRFSRHV